jgi:two-component system phosphate regulon sensor histidine kinase PhoR
MSEQLDDAIIDKLPPEIVEHIEILERMRKDFVANVSHELRTPLTVIMGYIEALRDEAKTNPHLPGPLFDKIYKQSLRMQSIIEDLLALSRIETNKQIAVSDENVDVNILLNTIVQSAEPLIQRKQQSVTVEIETSLKLAGNQEELHSLFSNLIFNAIKYTPDAGRINVRWYAKGADCIFEVQDTGIGIAPKYIPRLTERFYRVDKGRSRESGGTGLGLAIAKHILIRHKGHLEIESEEDKGRLFRCLFR